MKITFQFAGGPFDGKIVAGMPGQESEAERYYFLSHHGRIGQRFRTASQYAIDKLAQEKLQVDTPHRFQQHIYEVADRVEGPDGLLVRATYVSQEPTGERPV